MTTAPSTTDFSQGKVWKIILRQTIPLTAAQLVQLLYNVVDRIYIGHLPGADGLALTGIGLCFPLTTLIAAFTSMCSLGGTPLFSIARGAKKEDEARAILGNVCFLLLCFGLVLTVPMLAFRKPVLYLFGASDDSYVYADAYLKIYLLGTVFSMLGTGLNGFINAQGFPRMGMLTTVLGAVLNLVLDPLFIFVFHMGVAGAAIATVISQAASCAWVLRFLTGRRAVVPLKASCMRPQGRIIKRVCSLGLAGFIMQGTNCATQIACNTMLQRWGGDLYVGIMTVLNSVREIASLAVSGLAGGAQPVIGFNYGAKKYDRVLRSIRFGSGMGICYTVFVWILVLVLPRPIMRVFTNDPQTIEMGISALRLYFFGFAFMALQFSGQSVYQALGMARRAIFFSLLRKAVIVVPLTFILPGLGFGVNGVFGAEPISNVIGGTASFVTMYFTVYRPMKKQMLAEQTLREI